MQLQLHHDIGESHRRDTEQKKPTQCVNRICKVWEQAKILYGDKSLDNTLPWGQDGVTSHRRAREGLLGAGDVVS